MIALLLFVLVSVHNACTQSLIAVSTFPNAHAQSQELSSPSQQIKTPVAESNTVFMSQTRINCSSGSTPAHTLRFEEASQKWLIITAQKNATGPCVLSRQIVDNVTFFSSSQVAVYQNELFRKYIPGKKLGAELVAAVCKPLSDHLDIGQSRLAGLVIYWNQIDRRWQTRLDYHLLTESDHLTNVGPIGVWQKEDSFLLFNTSRVNSKREPAASQRQKMNLEISRPQNVNTSLTENIWPAVLNYTFKVYGNHVQEITDGPMNCWVSASGLDSN